MNGGPAGKFDINSLLEQAESENEKLRAKRMPADEPVKVDAGDKPVPDSSVKRDEKKDVTSEIIDRYSSRVKDPDPKSSTQSLRDSLNAHMEADKELLEYYTNGRPRHRSSKVDELYEAIRMATESDAKIRPIPHGDSRFVDESEIERPEEFSQGKLFALTDTIDLGEPSGETATYDEDYEKLSKRIEKGELDFSESEEGESEGQLSIVDELVPDELPVDTKRVSDDELRRALGMIEDDEDDAAEGTVPSERERRRQEKERREAEREKHEYEYTSKEQNAEITTMLKKAIRQSRLKLGGVLFFSLITLYFAFATPESPLHSEFLRQGRYGIVYILADLQILVFTTALIFESVKSGAVALFTGRPTSDSLLFVSVLSSVLYSVAAAFFAPTAEDFVPFSLLASASAVCSAAVKYMQCKKDYHCFRVIASKNGKYVASRLTGGTAEAEEFYKYLLDDSELYTVKRTEFVSGFFARLRRRPQSEDLFKLIIPCIIVASAVMFGIRMYGGSGFFAAFTDFIRVMAVSMPLTGFFMISLPVISANRIGRKCSSALIGNAVGEEYSDASVISFADTEVYPSNLVKITSIKTYGDYRIDMAVADMARVFAFIGGPLSKVLSNMLSEQVAKTENARVIESAADGVCVVIDGKEMFLGKRSYMRRYKFDAPRDIGDEEYENTVGSVMYMAIGDALVAKVYVRYSINPQFNELLRDLYKAGMCVGIKTLDPNISNELLSRGITFDKCPIAILKAGGSEEVTGSEKSVDTGIVTNASLHTFLKMFILCDKVRHVTKSNGVINILSVALSLFVVFFLSFAGGSVTVGPLFALVFQLLWIAPVWLISRIM